MIETADQIIPKRKVVKRDKGITKSTSRNYRIAKSLNKLFRFINRERAKSLKTIKSYMYFKIEIDKIQGLNYSMDKILNENTTREDLIAKIRSTSLDFQKIA